MPIYEFACRSCGEKFEKLCAMDVDDSTVECPKCSKTGAERLLSNFFSMSSGPESAACGAPGGSCATGCCPFQS